MSEQQDQATIVPADHSGSGEHRDQNDKRQNGDKKDNKQKKPDHGENFVPGSEKAPDNLAPQPLDHFKRGYKERADLRDREMGQLNLDFEHPPQHTQQPQPPPRYQSYSGDATNERRREEPNNLVGPGGRLDVPALVDRISRPGCNLHEELNVARRNSYANFESGKAVTAILSNLARRRKIGIALAVWQWMDQAGIEKNVFHYNSLISVCEKMKDSRKALGLLTEMERAGVKKNEVTFSSAISACEKCGQWRKAIELLDQMKKEGVGQTAIAYNAAISACEKGLVPARALEIFEQMKREGVTPTVVTFSALISACEKGQQWKLALEVLEEMKAAGHGANVIAYSAAISALSKGQQWQKALELFREIERSGGSPSVVTYNATITALEKGLQWERALDLFDEMKAKRLAVTVVSYGGAISACEKGFQWRQCLEYLDEMTEMGIKKNVIIFGAAMSCMEKCRRADIAFQLMDRMKIEGVSPNVHIFNSAISACARCDLWEKGLELFNEMEQIGVVRDVVSYNAVLDAVSSQVPLARKIFQEGVERGFYARVSRLGTQWLELDLHFLSLGGGEIALGWWFEVCLVPYLMNTSKLAAVQSIDIVTGYGKTRMRGARHGDDGMRKRVSAMLRFMNIRDVEQPNKGRIHIDKDWLVKEVARNGGKIIFDEEGYRRFRAEQTTANAAPDVPQKLRPKVVYERPPDRYRGGDDRRMHGGNRRREVNDPYDRRRERDSYQRNEASRNSYGRDDQRGRPRSPPRDNDRREASRYIHGYGRDDHRGRPRSPPRDDGRRQYHEGQRHDRYRSQDDYYRRDEQQNESKRGYRDEHSRRDSDRDFRRRHEEQPRYGEDRNRAIDGTRSEDYRGFRPNQAPEDRDSRRPRSDYPRHVDGRYGETHDNGRAYGHRQNANEAHRPQDDYRRRASARENDNRPEPETSDGEVGKKRTFSEYEQSQPQRGYDVEPRGYANVRGR